MAFNIQNNILISYVDYDGAGFVAVVEIPDGVNEISSFAFKGANISGVKIPSSVKRIGERAFENCRILKEVEIPYQTVSVGEEASKNCSNLTILRCGSRTRFGKLCFSGCESICKLVTKEKSWKVYYQPKHESFALLERAIDVDGQYMVKEDIDMYVGRFCGDTFPYVGNKFKLFSILLCFLQRQLRKGICMLQLLS